MYIHYIKAPWNRYGLFSAFTALAFTNKVFLCKEVDHAVCQQSQISFATCIRFKVFNNQPG